MRTQLLCTLALLCGAEVAHAQGWGTNTYNNYYQYPASYQAPGGYDYTGAYGSAGYYPAAYGYNYGNGYGNYNNANYGYAEYPVTDAAATPADAVPMDGGPEGAAVAAAVEPACKCRFWLAGDYMMSWVRDMHVNYPLVTIGSAADVHPGALGQPGTVIIVDDNINESMFNGFRIEGGVFLDDHQHWSVDVVAEYFGNKSLDISKQSDATGNPIIARPVFNVVTGTGNAFPDTGFGSTGGAIVDFRTEIYSTEINGAYHAFTCHNTEWDALVGFRYAHLQEHLNVLDQAVPLPGGAIFPFGGNPLAIAFPDSLQDQDGFRTNNNFYGLQFGGKFRWDCDWVFVNAFGKIALGANSQSVDINGFSTMITPTGNTVLPGGILALPSNIGHHTQTVFSILPEGGINIGLKLTNNIQAMVGYSCLFWTEVVRPGGQIDGGINGSQVPTSQFFGTPTGGQQRPLFQFQNETLWVQSLTFGMQIQY
jgi:hypothetical protein